jgi:hypothetical protein
MSRDGKDKSRLRSRRVENNAKTTGKLPGGITGKGFRPGRSGNPGGRPKTRPITTALVFIGESELPDRWRKRLGLWKGASWFDAAALGVFQAAAKGNPAAAKEIREAIEGKSSQRVELTGAGGEEIKAKVDAKLAVGDLLGALHQIYGLKFPSDSERKATSLQ